MTLAARLIVAKLLTERTRAGGGDAGRQGQGGAGRGLARERLRGPPARPEARSPEARGEAPGSPKLTGPGRGRVLADQAPSGPLLVSRTGAVG